MVRTLDLTIAAVLVSEGSVTAPPPPPWTGWPSLVSCAAMALYLYVRAARYGRRLGKRIGIAIGALVLLALPTLMVIASQDLTCRDDGVWVRSHASWGVLGVSSVAVLGALWLLGAASGAPAAAMARRAPVILMVLLLPAVIVEVMISSVPLDEYCEGSRGLLHLQAGLALLLPVLAVGLGVVSPGGGWTQHEPERLIRLVGGKVIMAVLVVLMLPVQLATLRDRMTEDPLACVSPRPLGAAARDAVTVFGIRGDVELAAADFDGDGAIDLAGVDESLVAHLLRNDGSGNLNAGAATPVGGTFYPFGPVAAGDIDGNGHADLVLTGVDFVRPPVGRSRHGAVSVVLNDGKALRARSPISLDGNERPRDLALGDLDGDGNVEIVVLDKGTAVVLRDRDGELEKGIRLTAPAEAASLLGQWRLALADVDGDGRTDVVTWVLGSGKSPSFVVLHRNLGPQRFSTSVAATVDDYIPGAVLADFDDDGDVDLVATGTEERLHVLANRGDGRFDHTVQPTKVGGQKLLAADFDADGRLDLVVSAEYSSEAARFPGELWVRLNLGDGRFSSEQRLAAPRTLLAVADLNGDRRADFVIHSFPDIVVLTSRACG